MPDANSVLREAETFNRRWRLEAPGFSDYADMLTEVKKLRLHAAEAALRLSKGADRDWLIKVRKKAATVEKSMRRRLTSGRHRPAPGGVF